LDDRSKLHSPLTASGLQVESRLTAVDVPPHQRSVATVDAPLRQVHAGEWQRDWARTEHVEELTEILIQHFSGSGIAYLWEQQLLNTPVPRNAG
jgi:hypothetical protein